MAPARTRNLLLAAGAAAALVAAGYDAWLWMASYAGDNFHNDFTFYYAAARLGQAHGWGGLYNLDLQQQQLDAIGSQIRIAQLARYVSPPPLAWLVVPLTALPFRVAYWLWSALLLAALGVAWYLTSPGRSRLRIILLGAAAGWLPIVYGLQLGQPALLVAAGVAGCGALLRRDRQVVAGALLGVIVLKPQLALLVPAALLVTGRWRAFAASAVVLAALAAMSAIALGPDGVSTYMARLSFATTVPENQSQTLAAWIHNLTATRVVEAVIFAWTLALAYRLRSRGTDAVIAIALVGGLAASPYTHYDDLTMLGLAALLYVRTSQTRWTIAYVIAMVVAGEGFPIWGAGPVLVMELGALVLWSVAAVRDGGSEAEPIPGRSALAVTAGALGEPLRPGS